MSQLPRNRQAFEALLTPDDDSDDGGGGGGRGKRGKRRGSKGGRPGGSGSSRVPGFKLREEAATEEELGRICELFAGTLPADVITQVFHACGASPEMTVDTLLAMDSEGAVPAGLPPDASTAPAAAAAAAAAAEPRYWDALPLECKDLVLASLSLRDMARAAGACKELAARVRAHRAQLTTVHIPPGVSAAALRGLVAAFEAATAVDLSRWGRDRGSYFDPQFSAVAAGAEDR